MKTFLVPILLMVPAWLPAQQLDACGSREPVHTVFTNPGQDCSTSVNISFATPQDSEVKIKYFTAGDTLAVTSRGEFCSTFDSLYSKLADNTDVYERHKFYHHKVILPDLKPATDYTYVIETADGTYASPAMHFRTAGDSVWSAAVIGDFHHYSPLGRRLTAAMAMLDTLSATHPYTWVLSTGDQCAWGGSYNYWTELSGQPAYRNYMWGAVEGNHDHQSGKDGRTDAYFRDTHNNPANGYPGQEGVAYWFRYGDVLFFMLNNEAMRTQQSLEPVFAWMRTVASEVPAKYIVAVQHYEWLIGTDGSDSQLDRFRDLFDELGVDLAIAGNNHAYIRTPALHSRKPVAASQGTFYVVTPSSDNSRGRALKPLAANQDIVSMRWSEGSRTVGAMIMDVTPQRIVMTLYDRDGKVQDSFTVPAKR